MIYLRVALRNLLQARRRTFLLGSALMLVTLLLILLMSLSQGLSETMIHSATTLSAGHVNIGGFYKAKPSDAIPIVTKKDRIKKIIEENTEGLEFVIDRHRGWARMISDTSSMYAGLAGVNIETEGRLKGALTVLEGDLDDLGDPRTVVLFETQAKQLEVSVGDPITITGETNAGAANTTDVRVAAIAKDMGFMSNWRVFVSQDTVLELYRLAPDATGVVMIYLKDPKRTEQTMGHLRTVFEGEGYRLMDHVPQPFWMKFENVAGEDWTGQKLDLTTWRDEVSFMTWVLRAIDSISFFLVAILTVIIAAGIMNSLWIAVRERTQEIGTLRAIGMTRKRVLMMFMTEALLLGFGATALGAVLGAGIARAVDAAEVYIPIEAVQAILMSDTLHLSVTVPQLVGAVLAFTVVTGLSALWPAARASRLQPITAIHHVG